MDKVIEESVKVSSAISFRVREPSRKKNLEDLLAGLQVPKWHICPSTYCCQAFLNVDM